MPERRLSGQWWIPGSDDNRTPICGTFLISESHKCSLELIGSLSDSPLGDDDKVIPIVHGAADGHFITLIDCSTAGASTRFGPDCETSYQRLRPHCAIIGMHLLSKSEEVFHGIDVEVDNLTSWAATTRIKRTDLPETRLPVYEVMPFHAPSAAFEGKTIDLLMPYTWRTREGTSDRTLTIREQMIVRITSSIPTTWEGLLSTARSFRDLMTLVSRRPSSIRAVHLHQRRDDGDTESFELIDRNFPDAKPPEEPPNVFLFYLSDVDFQDLIHRWENLRRRIGVAVHALFSLDYLPSGYVENRILSAAAVAESFHRGLFPEARGLEGTRHQKLLQHLDKLDDRSLRHWAKNRLRNDCGYMDRLLALSELPSQSAVNELLTDRLVWARWLRDSRNALAHLDYSDFRMIPKEARNRLAYITSALLHLVLLNELGLSAKIQENAVKLNYYYSAAKFGATVSTHQRNAG
jgi:ApeA N-terminal domain 1